MSEMTGFEMISDDVGSECLSCYFCHAGPSLFYGFRRCRFLILYYSSALQRQL